ncbi:uncharacterized protein PGTG_22451 [Puccinia graminis f. sp. tritici CRL 75-36-700-3]|uniref:Uncharacterized protein n=1 Tax=Puccinia graminis f. sp. tritici (strain CRL 75-36-700-3 / race SCCL) TaxID=418459 RepID=H6QUG9_PUCGT|nr:uncharacterized protein PGTG_22451 [Puccinia graminis f. sp. tritici CRL 75-36-700-3]EHS64635.1 hypothetical protein PGTG_22451 [Puccinia graminis f. sp. tritici CRL 75-36-700-3]
MEGFSFLILPLSLALTQKDLARDNGQDTPPVGSKPKDNSPVGPNPASSANPTGGPALSLDQIVKNELNKTGLSGIDNNLLKFLLICNLMGNSSSLGETGSAMNLASNFLKWHQLGKKVAPPLSICHPT